MSSSLLPLVPSPPSSSFRLRHRRTRPFLTSAKLRSCSPSSWLSRVSCSGGSQRQSVSGDLDFVLHRALDSSGVATLHAKEARQGFLAQIEKLTGVERETSISINRRVDLGKAALYIAAEDDALVSHSSVALPVDAFTKRLDNLFVSYIRSYNYSFYKSPEIFLKSLETYMFVDKGFQRTNVNPSDLRPLYLHSVLMRRTGSAAMLSLIYSEILKMLRMWGLLDFDAEIFYPHDRFSLPRGYHKHRSKESDQPHILTVQSFFEETLRSLKYVFWPFQHDHWKSLFLRAAEAATCIDRSNSAKESGSQLAAAKAARHRLERGVWTSVRFGDMRCALSACERLILLNTDPKELRDYSILLYHCGFYKESLQFLKLYRESQEPETTTIDSAEKEAEDKLMFRLNLISMEEGWSSSSYSKNYLSNNSEPW